MSHIAASFANETAHIVDRSAEHFASTVFRSFSPDCIQLCYDLSGPIKRLSIVQGKGPQHTAAVIVARTVCVNVTRICYGAYISATTTFILLPPGACWSSSGERHALAWPLHKIGGVDKRMLGERVTLKVKGELGISVSDDAS